MTEHQPTLDSQARFYDERWETAETRLNHLQVMRLAAVLEGFSVILRDGGEQGLNICDLGCGTGWLTNEITKFGHVTGIDLSQKGIELARARWPGITFLCGDALEYRPDSRFDVVVSSEVIEHVPDQEGYVRTISAILEPGGYVILTCPNNRAKRAWEKAGNVNQPIELWPTRTQIPGDYWKPQPAKLDRMGLISALSNGRDIPGAVHVPLPGADAQGIRSVRRRDCLKMPLDHLLLTGDQDDEHIEYLEIGHVEGCAGDAVGDEAHPKGSRQVVDPLQRGQIAGLLDELVATAPGP